MLLTTLLRQDSSDVALLGNALASCDGSEPNQANVMQNAHSFVVEPRAVSGRGEQRLPRHEPTASSLLEQPLETPDIASHLN